MSRFGILLAAVAFGGCMNLRAATSGEIGCPESQIDIRDESTGIGSKTWTAECNGQVYYCSYQSTGEKSGQYSCSADASAEGDGEAPAVAEQDQSESQERATSEPSPTSDPPTEAVGFTLAQGVQSAEEKCAQAGHTWSVRGDAHVCSGTPVAVGVEAQSRLVFCDDQLCDLTVFVTFQGDDEGADTQVKKIVDAMREKYGKPKKVREGGLPSCKADGLVRCTSSGGAFLTQTWEWKSGEKIYLELKGKQGQAVLAVRYLAKSATAGGAEAF